MFNILRSGHVPRLFTSSEVLTESSERRRKTLVDRNKDNQSHQFGNSRSIFLPNLGVSYINLDGGYKGYTTTYHLLNNGFSQSYRELGIFKHNYFNRFYSSNESDIFTNCYFHTVKLLKVLLYKNILILCTEAVAQ